VTKLGKIFKFVPPEGWVESLHGSRHTFRGPNNEELIISSAVIHGTGTSTDLQKVQPEVFQNAQKSVEKAAEHPELAIIQRFQREQCKKNECWTIRAQTRVGDVLFFQAVFPASRGFLLATYEGPNTERSVRLFEEFLKSVEVISEAETLVE